MTGVGALLLIALVQQAPSVKIFPEGSVSVVTPDGKTKPLDWKGELTLLARAGGLRLADLRLDSGTRLVPEGAARIRVGQNPHRGTLILRREANATVTVVEELHVEEYLEGVLPHEMDPEWPLEALKAQAVVARTFTYANMGKFRAEGFDLTADTRSQVYKGTSRVNENVRAAVRQTRGELLGYEGKLLGVYYHACCGGETTDAGAAWNADAEVPRPLRGVKDRWCRTSPHMNWSAYFTWPDLNEAIARRRMPPGLVTSLKIGARDAAGYVRTFVASCGGEKINIRAAELRAELGAGELKSVRIKRVKAKKKGVEFSGSGLGHGVGLCQWGARGQSEKGRSYEQILSFYFPGSVLSEIDE